MGRSGSGNLTYSICCSFLMIYTSLGTLISFSPAAEITSSCDIEHTCQQILLSKPRKNSIPGYAGTTVREVYLCLGHCGSTNQLLKLIKSKFHGHLYGKGNRVT